ncbi:MULTISPECIES: hypothetical protein [unclassified Paenibacillus]|uniref:hypothetical protein n=1 Tax=unclassified Paenibacillus TaxID=185978 RepID=UPI0004F68104|nr:MULTISPECIES: hypothetical protein [unclassified Paenibacillus]AIQ29368.1 hypothetical protein P40081_15325 [Paenibacillus sp. FSL P4-0081]OMF30960.1 hypothetical protein BK132_05890 [Paenibacillus sp. FSL H8-0259]
MSLQLIDAIQNTHKADAAFMALLKLLPTANGEQMAARFTKGVEPEIVVSKDTVPHICQYIMPGQYGRNHLVFKGKFCLDFYGKTGYEAKLLFERSFKLFHDDHIIQPGFNSFRCSLAYDGDFSTGIAGVKGYKGIYDVDYIRTN